MRMLVLVRIAKASGTYTRVERKMEMKSEAGLVVEQFEVEVEEEVVGG